MAVCMKKLTNDSSQDRGTVAVNVSLPLGAGPSRTQPLTDKSDYIVQLLMEAGLTKPKKSFLKNYVVFRHLSPAMVERLTNLR